MMMAHELINYNHLEHEANNIIKHINFNLQNIKTHCQKFYDKIEGRNTKSEVR